MCGVAGIVSSPNARVSESRLGSMRAAIAHRGPDAEGMLLLPSREPRVGLAHTRLSILDLGDAAAQPMTSHGVTVSYNGEIYNYVELRDELAKLGHHFTSSGDTEVLLRAYLQWGIGFLDKLIGMFSILLFDERVAAVYAIRDPFGIKPLYYARDASGVSFASEIKAIRAGCPSLSQVSMDSVARYLRYGTAESGTNTMFVGIHQVRGGHYLRVGLDDLDIREACYFTPQESRFAPGDLSFDEATDAVRSALMSSLSMHLRSDVPLGFALSGGVDSSSIVSAARLVDPTVDMHCFTYSASGSALDERKWAEMVARSCGARLHVTAPSVEELLRDMPAVTRAMDEPLASTSVYAQYRVFALARERGMKVVLDGQGADELFGGYDRYVWARVATLLRRGQLLTAIKVTNSARARGISVPTGVLRTLDYFMPERASERLMSVAGRDLVPDWISPSWRPATSIARPGLARRGSSNDYLLDRLLGDIETDTLPSLLRYDDRNSMAWSIESRVPFLTPDLYRLALALPDSYLVSNSGVSKSVLRAAMRGVVPDAVLDRKDKIGFAPPEADWMRSAGRFTSDLLADARNVLPFLDFSSLPDELAGSHSVSAQAWRICFMSIWARECGVTFIKP